MAFFRTADWGTVLVTGPDARAFLQRMTTANITILPAMRHVPALVLDGVSTVVADFLCLCTGEDTFRLLAKGESLPALYEHLESMHFAEDLELKLIESTPAAEVWSGPKNLHSIDFQPPGSSSQAFEPLEVDREEVSNVEFFVLPLFHEFWSLYLPVDEDYTAEQVARRFMEVDNEHFRETSFWQTLRIMCAIPRLETECRGPGAKALDVGFLRWLDREKGCYPGQEAVEKSLNIGHPAKALVRLKIPKPGEAPVKVPQKVIHSETKQPIGELTSISHVLADESEIYGLAVIRWKFRAMTSSVIVLDESGHRIFGKICT